jgi:hypothetical protein
MGIPTGEFTTICGQSMHVEVSSGMVVIYMQIDESGHAIRLTPREARRAVQAIECAADIEEGVSADE